MFHLDEYVGRPPLTQLAFACLLERLIHKAGITQHHVLDGKANPCQIVRRVAESAVRRRLM